MKGICFTLVLALTIFQCRGQIDPVGAFNRHIMEAWKGEYVRIGPYRVKGTPYLLGESFPGNITYKGGKTVANAKILYDIYHQKVGIDTSKQMFEADEPVETFYINLPEKFGRQKLLFKNCYVFGKPEMNCFFNVLSDGSKVTFLKAFKTQLFQDPTNNMAKDLRVFNQYFEYYIYSKSTGDINKIKLRKKDILKELGNEKVIVDYMSSNEIDLSKEADVIKLITKYNSI